MKEQQCKNCTFSNWYDNFKDVTFRSKVIELSPNFVVYLKSDGIVLPDAEETLYSNSLTGYSDSDSDDGWDEEISATRTSLFPDLKAKVESAIKELGGSIFPKLNWSSPRDAAWIAHNGSLKCGTFNEICLLLKSSDFITHDLCSAYEGCEDSVSPSCADNQFELVLRRWKEVSPGMEFRCFVKQRKLVRISQRHPFYFHYLEGRKAEIFDQILQFYNSKVKNNFAESDFVFDIFIDHDFTYLVDFNPYAVVTDPILLNWEDLNEIDANTVDTNNHNIFVIMTEDNGIQPSQFMTYGLPKDMVDLAHGQDVHKMMDLLNLRDLVCKADDTE